MSKFAPEAHLAASTNNRGDFYPKTAQAVMAGTSKSGGLAQGMVRTAPLNAAIPPDAAKRFEEKKAAMMSGKIKPFQGPLKDRSSAVKVAAGSELALAALKGIYWYVLGVEGTIPK